MSIFNIPCYPCDKELFPGAQLSPDDQRESTTFYNDFKIAEMFGIRAVKETFNRAFKEWKNDIKYLTELASVVNHLLFEHYNTGYADLARFYNEAYCKICGCVYQADAEGNNASPFTDEEVQFFHNVLD